MWTSGADLYDRRVLCWNAYHGKNCERLKNRNPRPAQISKNLHAGQRKYLPVLRAKHSMSSTRPQTPGRPRARIETLADLIFGFALSIGAIALIGSPPTSAGDINTRILEFMFTFFILITAWIIYTTQMSVLPLETRAVTLLNVLMLALVAVVPYLLFQSRVRVD